MVEDLGVEPSPSLRAVERELLTHDSTPAIGVPGNSFVGRSGELAAAVELLGRARLVTLTGPGGAGKSRLALHTAAAVADRFPGGVLLCELAPVGRPEAVSGRWRRRSASTIAPAVTCRSGSSSISAGRRRCWCWTTASTCSMPPPSWSSWSCPGRPTLSCWRRAGTASVFPASTSYRSTHSAWPTTGRRSSCSTTGPRPCVPASTCPATPPRSPRSSAARRAAARHRAGRGADAHPHADRAARRAAGRRDAGRTAEERPPSLGRRDHRLVVRAAVRRRADRVPQDGGVRRRVDTRRSGRGRRRRRSPARRPRRAFARRRPDRRGPHALLHARAGAPARRGPAAGGRRGRRRPGAPRRVGGDVHRGGGRRAAHGGRGRIGRGTSPTSSATCAPLTAGRSTTSRSRRGGSSPPCSGTATSAGRPRCSSGPTRRSSTSPTRIRPSSAPWRPQPWARGAVAT